jgi:PEP-CTERM motif
MMERTMKPSAFACALWIAGALTAAAQATPITLTMDEVPYQPIDGLVVSKGGLDFFFSDPGHHLYYNDTSFPSETFIQGPTIAGLAESFTITFSRPIYSFQFLALAEDSLVPLSGADVRVNGGPHASFPLFIADPFAEGTYGWFDDRIDSVTITPAPGAVHLAFDNFRVVPWPVPEPASLIVVAGGLLFAFRRRRRRGAA